MRVTKTLIVVPFRSLCAFLNSGKCGTVYLGIQKDGVVAGLKIDRHQVQIIIVHNYNIKLAYHSNASQSSLDLIIILYCSCIGCTSNCSLK